jgi:hypothetical protein
MWSIPGQEIRLIAFRLSVASVVDQKPICGSSLARWLCIGLYQSTLHFKFCFVACLVTEEWYMLVHLQCGCCPLRLKTKSCVSQTEVISRDKDSFSLNFCNQLRTLIGREIFLFVTDSRGNQPVWILFAVGSVNLFSKCSCRIWFGAVPWLRRLIAGVLPGEGGLSFYSRPVYVGCMVDIVARYFGFIRGSTIPPMLRAHILYARCLR